MNHLAARQLADGPSAGKWHYTLANSRTGTHAIGYCAPYDACPAGCYLGKVHDGAGGGVTCETCGARGVVELGEPCPGHDTPEEAAEHYRQYLLDKRLRFVDDRPEANVQTRCVAAGCGAWTSGGVWIAGWVNFALCADHRTREAVSALYATVGESWES